jgi:hypothetical protein
MNAPHDFDDDDILRLLADENEIPAPDPLCKASARQNYLLHASRLRAGRGRSRNLASQSIFSGLRMAFRVMTVVVLVVSGLLAGTVYAAADSLPGDFLYPLNLQVEEAQLGLAREPDRAARLALSFADKRLNEIERLVAAGRQKDIPVALQEYQHMLANPGLSADTDRQGETVTLIVEALAEQEDRLLAIRSRMDAQNSAALDSAIDALERKRQSHSLNAPVHDIPGQGNPNLPGLDNPPGLGAPTPPAGGIPRQDNPTPPGQGSPNPPGMENPPGQGNPGQGNPTPPGQGNPNPPGGGRP